MYQKPRCRPADQQTTFDTFLVGNSTIFVIFDNPEFIYFTVQFVYMYKMATCIEVEPDAEMQKFTNSTVSKMFTNQAPVRRWQPLQAFGRRLTTP